MADESEYLIPSSNQLLNRNMEQHTSATILKQQSDEIAELRHQLVAERETNLSVSKKVDLLCVQFEKLTNKYTIEMKEKDKEIEKLKRTLEAHNESQAAVADELRFQMRSLRNKLDPKNHVTENDSNKIIESHKSKLPHSMDAHNILKRQNSADSVCSINSNPCFSSHITTTQRGEITWRINGFAKKLKRISTGQYEDPVRSEPFTTGPCGYRLSAWAYLNGRGKGQDRHLSVYIRVMAGEYDPILVWPIKPSYSFCLMSQDSDTNKRLDLLRVRDLSVKHSGIFRPQKDDKTIIVGFDDFIPHEDLEKKHYLLDDSLFLKIMVDIPPP